jgi:hypothetical protein
MGVHPKVVQELLGHNRIQETVDTYSQVLPTIHREAIKRLEDVLWKKDDNDNDDDGLAGAKVRNKPKK